MDPLCLALEQGRSVSLKALIDAWQRHLPLLAKLCSTAQDPPWHGEGDVETHTAMVLKEVQQFATEELSHRERFVLALSAVFHDIGKPLVTQTRELNGVSRIVSPRHAEAGRSYLALRLAALELPRDIEDHIISLTGYHHHPRRLVQDAAPLALWRQLARQCSPKLLYWLEIADLRGRRCSDLEAQLEIIELFRLECLERGLWENPDPWSEWREAISEAFASRSDAFKAHAFEAAVRDAERGVIQCVEEGIARAFQLKDKPTRLVLLVGPAGAGKSEWTARHAGDAHVISLDALREQITGKREDQSMNGQVIQAAKERLKECLRSGKSVVWDATNTRRDSRGWVVQLGLDYGAHVQVVALQTPVSALLTRNRKREHPVPTSVLERQIETLEWPTLDEAHAVEFYRDLPPH